MAKLKFLKTIKNNNNNNKKKKKQMEDNEMDWSLLLHHQQ